jgi:PAS domain S-box-containing protein
LAHVERPSLTIPIRRDTVLEALAFAAERFLLSPDWRQCADEVLARLGGSVDSSRASILENVVNVAGEVCYSVSFEWCAPGVRPVIHEPEVSARPWDARFSTWYEALAHGEAVAGSVLDEPAPTRDELMRQGIRSFAYTPINVEGAWWGCIGVSDCERDREWSSADLEGLRTAAAVLGAAIGRARQEERLREAEARYRSVVEHIPAVTYFDVKDASGVRMAFLSPQIEPLLGYPAADFLADGEVWFDLIHPADRERIDAAASRTGQGIGLFDEEYRMRTASGEWIWVHDATIPIRDEHGDVTHFQGFMIDISARKQAEMRHREVVESIPAVTYIDQPTGLTGPAGAEITFISPQVTAMLGYPPARFTGSADFWFRIMHPDDLSRLEAENAFDVGDSTTFDQEYRMRHADGRWVWVHDSSTAVLDPDGEIAYFQGFMIDITERKEAELHLREAEERFRTIVENNPAVIYTQAFDAADPAVSRTTYISPRIGELLGYGADETLADPTLWSRLIHPQDRERVLAADVDSNRRRPKHFSEEYRMIAKDGRIVWVQDAAELVSVEGRPPFWQGFMLDITERKRAEEHLAGALEVEREAARRLRSLDEMKNTFLQAVSHDLRTPLAAILGLAITLERSDVHLEEDDTKDLARRIAGNARRLDRLVKNLLDLDRIARGIVTPKREPTDVGALVRRVIAESEQIEDARMRLDLQPVLLPLDGAKVERIVENLLANTSRHTPAGSTIWVSVHPDGDGVMITVEDDGPGVEPDLRDAIFEPFRQGPDAPRHSPGVGVGLTLVRRLAELHGGRAWVQDREGGGASFRVFLPSEPETPPEP